MNRMLKAKKPFRIFLTAAILLLCVFAAIYYISKMPPEYHEATEAQKKVLDYASAHGLSYADYPKSLIDLLERNPETEKFVLEYPTAHKTAVNVNLSEYADTETVPLFMQWDQQWGYIKYGSDVAGITGCGPVCLSMAAFYLTKDPAYAPDKLIQFASDNGYYVKGSGSSWTLISEGGVKLGFAVNELPLDKNRILKELKDGRPIICVMGPGDFTTSGHYIVLTGSENGMLKINDPNSRTNSQKLWTYEQISGQIRNLWSVGMR